MLEQLGQPKAELQEGVRPFMELMRNNNAGEGGGFPPPYPPLTTNVSALTIFSAFLEHLRGMNSPLFQLELSTSAFEGRGVDSRVLLLEFSNLVT